MNIMRYTVLALLVVSSGCFSESLDQAVQRSMITNPDILYNTAKALSSKNAVDKAKGAYYPTVDVNAGYGREWSKNPTTQAIGGTGSITLNRRESSVELRENIFAGGGIVNEYKRNKFMFEADKLKSEGVAEDLALDATNQYLLVLLNTKLVSLANTNYQVHLSLMDMVKQRADAGVSREAELSQAQARVALAKSNKINAEANLREARINYAKVVGAWPAGLSWPRLPNRVQLPSSLPLAIEKGLENHPTIRSSYADIKEAKAQYDVARAAYYPKVDLVLSASKNKNLDGLIGPNDDRLAMVRMNYNIFRGGSDVAHVKETAYQVQEAFEIKNKALVDLKEKIRLSWNAWQATNEKMPALRAHVTAARTTRAAYQDQFKLGKRTLLDLLDSQNEYYESQLNLERGMNDEAFSRYRLINGMGGLLKYFNLRLPQNVVNNSVFSSAQTHVLLNEQMDKIPYPDTTDQSLSIEKPVREMDSAPLTPQIINKNTALQPVAVTPKVWFVSTGVFKERRNADALASQLRGQGFLAMVVSNNNMYRVQVGGYEYRGNAANVMERMKEIAHVQGVLITDRPYQDSSIG
jgi:adhesin transport system outer membrane protein